MPALTPTIVLACLILLLPLWAFGFGLAGVLKRNACLPLVLVMAYPIFAVPPGVFRWDMCLGMAAIVIATGLLVERGHDWIALAILGISVDLRFFNDAWPVAGLSGLTKLMFVDTGLYAYLVLAPSAASATISVRACAILGSGCGSSFCLHPSRLHSASHSGSSTSTK